MTLSQATNSAPTRSSRNSARAGADASERRGLVAQNGRHDGDGVLSVEGPPSAGDREALPRDAAGASRPDGGRAQDHWERRTSPRWAGLMRKLNLPDS